MGAAVTIGQHPPGHVGQVLIDAARQAFVTGSDRAVLVAIGAAVIGTLAAPFFLPARRVSQPAGHAPAATPNEPARAELSRTFAGVSAR